AFDPHEAGIGLALAALEERRLPLPHPDAERGETVGAAPPAELVQKRDDEACPAHPERMAERDRPAVHVHALLVEAELADDADARRARARSPRRARRRSVRPPPPRPSAAASAARKRPAPHAKRASARPRSRPSRPSTRAETALPGGDSGTATRGSCPTRSGC